MHFTNSLTKTHLFLSYHLSFYILSINGILDLWCLSYHFVSSWLICRYLNNIAHPCTTVHARNYIMGPHWWCRGLIQFLTNHTPVLWSWTPPSANLQLKKTVLWSLPKVVYHLLYFGMLTTSSAHHRHMSLCPHICLLTNTAKAVNMK